MSMIKRGRVSGQMDILAEKTVNENINCHVCKKIISESEMNSGCDRKDCPFGNRSEQAND